MDTQQVNSFKVLLIGDSCIDEYRIGTVDRLSPEAPVPVIKLIDQYQLPGMASNVHHNLKKLGVDPDFITNEQQITKTRYIDQRSGQHLLRVDSEPEIINWSGNSPLPIEQYDAIVISDYNKGFLSYDNIEQIIKSSKGPVFIDTKKTDLARFTGAIIKINETEFKSCQTKNDLLIVTLGSKGAALIHGEQQTYFSTEAVPVVDVCGCGDTFLSALVYQYIMTKNLESSIIFANRAASITVQHQGNYAPSKEEIDA